MGSEAERDRFDSCYSQIFPVYFRSLFSFISGSLTHDLFLLSYPYKGCRAYLKQRIQEEVQLIPLDMIVHRSLKSFVDRMHKVVERKGDLVEVG